MLRLDLGVQISNRPYKHGGTGGRFQLMIPAGSAAPTTCEMSFTTVVDAQQVAKANPNPNPNPNPTLTLFLTLTLTLTLI